MEATPKVGHENLITLETEEVTLGRPDYSKMILSLDGETFAEPFAKPATVDKVFLSFFYTSIKETATIGI